MEQSSVERQVKNRLERQIETLRRNAPERAGELQRVRGEKSRE